VTKLCPGVEVSEAHIFEHIEIEAPHHRIDLSQRAPTIATQGHCEPLMLFVAEEIMRRAPITRLKEIDGAGSFLMLG
jgi:hypothetical protein